MLKLRELIKKVRGCKTAEEERSVINKECAEIRNMSKELSDSLKSRNLAKCIFIHMLGYPTNFIQMTCVNLLQSNKFTEKRIAYVALCILMDEKSEVLLLTSNSIKKDLESSNQYIVAVALNAIGEVCTADLCRDLSVEVAKLMNNPNPYIKKKAALAATRIIKKCPELLETFADKLGSFFEDKNHGVLICGISLAILVFRMEPAYIDKYRKYMGGIIKYLRNLVSTNYAPEYDINGVTDPFLQVKFLEILQYFGRNNVDSSEEMNDILASISTNTESNKNTGNAVLYELVRTIISIESNSGLKSLGSTILGRFLGNKENNYKYIALNTLQEVAKLDLNSVQKHKNTILDCLKDSDISIKRRALDLTYIIVNTSNIKQIIKECLNFLLIAEPDLKLELTFKITQALDKYSPSLKWQIDTLIKMLCLAGTAVAEETASSIINLIVSTTELHLYSVHKIFLAIKNNLGQEGLVKVGVYILGEFGDMLINNSVQGPDAETIVVTEEEVMDILQEIFYRRYSNSSIKEYLLNCLLKLSVKFPGSIDRINGFLEEDSKSAFYEVQQRAVEYTIFSKINDYNLKAEITKNTPLSKIVKDTETVRKEITKEEYDNDENEEDSIRLNQDMIQSSTQSRASTSGMTSGKTAPQKSGGNLIDFENIFAQPQPTLSSSQSEATVKGNDFNDIFSMINQPVSSGNPMDNLFGNSVSATATATATVSASNPGESQKKQDTIDIFSQISNIYGGNTSTPAQPKNSDGGFMDLFGNSSGTNTASAPNNQGFGGFDLLAGMGGFSGSAGVSGGVQSDGWDLMSGVQTSSSTETKKKIYENNEISIFCSSNKVGDSTNATFYLSNNCNSVVSNVKVNLMVIKYVTYKSVSSTGTQLEPRQNYGIKKEFTFTNTQPEKKIVLKIKYSYTVDGQERGETFAYDEL